MQGSPSPNEQWLVLDGHNLGAHIEVFPASTPQNQLPHADCVLARQHSHLAISWAL